MAFCSQCGHKNPDEIRFCASCGHASHIEATPVAPTESNKKRSYRVWVFAALGVVAVFVVLIGVTTLSRVGALTRNAVIDVVPVDAEMYFEIDLLEVSEENFQVLIDAFSDPLDEEGLNVGEPDDIFTVFDDILYDEFQMTVEDDVMPWIGRYIGAAVFDTVPSTNRREDDYYYLEDWLEDWAVPWGDAEGETLFVFQVREPELADEFLLDLADEFEDQGWSVGERTIEGLDFFEVDEIAIGQEYDYDFVGELVFGRSDDVVLISGSRGLVRDALETQAGVKESIVDSEGFLTTMQDLPDNSVIRGYWSESGVKDFTESYGQLADLDRRASGAFGGVSAAGWFTDSGFRATSSVAIDTEKLPDDAVLWLEQLGDSDPLGAMPAGRSAYVSVPDPSLLLDAYCDATGDDWYCEQADQASSTLVLGATTLTNDFALNLEMAAFVDAAAARAFIEDDVSLYGDTEAISDSGGDALWTTERPDENYYSAKALAGSTGWQWWGRSEAPERRTDDAIREIEAIASDVRIDIPAEAYESLWLGSVPLSFVDAGVVVAALEAGKYESERDLADVYRPFRWAIAGLAWDGTRLHASGAIEWNSSDNAASGG